MADKPRALTVIALTHKIRQTLEGSFKDIWVEGELSNVRIQASGHAYFTLKDAQSQLPVAMFAGSLRSVKFRLTDGLKVVIRGDISVYPPRGAYQLIASHIEKLGAGDLMAQFEELKRKLEAEGLFDKTRKRPLPLLPRTIGIVTSPTGAAIRDMLTVTRRRFPNLHIILAPAKVQGEGAAAEIAAAIAMFNSAPDELRPDVLIVGRGGGSIEDLWCFNEEIVARAIFKSEIPVISAVGHEIDFTISDFVADLRAPTPSAAAEVVVGRKDEFLAQLATCRESLVRELRHALQNRRARLERARSHHVFRQPETALRHHTQRLDYLDARLRSALLKTCQARQQRFATLVPRMRLALVGQTVAAQRHLGEIRSNLWHLFEMRRSNSAHRVESLAHQLTALSPLAVLQRGYSVTLNARGEVVRTAQSLRPGELVETRLADSSFHSTVVGSDIAAEAPAPPPASAPARPAPRSRRKPPPGDDASQLTLF